MNLKWTCLLFLCLFYAGAHASTDDLDDRPIASSDIIIIEVFEEKNLCVERRVQASGTISYPLLGTVEVAGKTPGEVARLLADRLGADYLVNPEVTVSVKQYRSRTISVIGKVNKEGAVVLPEEQKMDVMEAIAFAGGFQPTANQNRIEVTRSGKTTAYRFEDLKKITDESKKIWLQPGDVIYVRERFF
jgi:polysaccharide biosynthesis/export protein